MTNVYPILIIQQPHRGPRKEWVLQDENHLQRCIDQDSGGYDNWCVDNDYITHQNVLDDDGDIIDTVVTKDESCDLDVYLEFLGSDVQSCEKVFNYQA
jgi:hypothetical protein